MTKVLPRKEQSEIEATGFLRSQRPDDHREFEKLLPWFTPLFVYRMAGRDWVRWSVPPEVGEKIGLSGGCAGCGCDSQVGRDEHGFQIDTAWAETDWWLLANGYELPECADPVANRNTPPSPQQGEQS